MRWKTILHSPLTAFVPSLGILVALAAAAGSAALAPNGVIPRPLEMLGYLLLGTLAALYRPGVGAAVLGASPLGLATLILPAALLRLGPLPAALLAGCVALAADLSHRSAAAGRAAGAVGRSLDGAVLTAGAVLAAGAAGARWLAPAPILGWRALVPAAAYFAGLFLLILIRRWLAAAGARRAASGEVFALVAPFGLEAAGWAIGTLLYDSAEAGGWGRVGALMTVVALAAAEAARNALLLGKAELRLVDLERLQHAHRRILGEISGMGGIAQQILVECRNILPVQWFQFELRERSAEPQPGDGTGRSWAAGPEGVLVAGEPRPEARPRTLPGVHRRVAWRVLEKELEVEGETLAVVRLWCDPRRIEAGAEELLATLVPQMASSVHRARLDREAKIDPLTGVPVRRELESRLQRAYSQCCEEGRSLAVILCDIDHFKKINDTYGHAAGDEALKLFARTLDAHRRERDLCCRFGGEEFTLLAEDTGGEAALALAERLREAVAALELEFAGEIVPLTFSAGVAAFPELHVKTASELLLLADEALYEAKEQGRNRCLLNLGRGRFRAPGGRTFGKEDPPPQPRIPRLFG